MCIWSSDRTKAARWPLEIAVRITSSPLDKRVVCTSGLSPLRRVKGYKVANCLLGRRIDHKLIVHEGAHASYSRMPGLAPNRIVPQRRGIEWICLGRNIAPA